MNETQSLTKTGTFWLPEAISDYARDFDSLYYFYLYSSIVCLFIVVIPVLYFVVKYRRTDKNLIPQKQIEHNIKLELTWIIIPLLLVQILFVWGLKDFMKIHSIPSNAVEYKVVAQKWSWVFFYPNGFQTTQNLVVPKGETVKLTMTSKDVIHSFFLPNYRIKRDVIPNRYTYLWFKAEKKGAFQIFCTEYCGDEHANMIASLTVLDKVDYANFLKKSTELSQSSPVDRGKKLYSSLGCAACHSVDGSQGVGPTWKGIFGKQQEFNQNDPVLMDENYLRDSIVEPNKKIVKGYPPVMASYSYLSDDDIDGLIEYIKTLK